MKIIDSTTIQLFSEILRGVGRNPKEGSRKKGGIKVHSLMDTFSGITEFLRITATKEHDKGFLHHIEIKSIIKCVSFII
ncbi:MAG: transposase [Bacteroidales bacterium]|nr:transposase [Bacteroidales bacterium]